MKLLFSKEVIARRIGQLAARINHDYGERPVVLVVLLKGAQLFAADLCRHLTCPVRLEFMRVCSYGAETASSGCPRILLDLDEQLRDCHILLVDDILDTGLTLHHLSKHLRQHQPASIRTCVLIDKYERRQVAIAADYAAIELQQGFVVGFGMDYNEQYRNLDAIYCLEAEDLAKESHP